MPSYPQVRLLINTDKNILGNSNQLVTVSWISRSGSTELLPLMQSFSLKEAILYSQSREIREMFTN